MFTLSALKTQSSAKFWRMPLSSVSKGLVKIYLFIFFKEYFECYIFFFFVYQNKRESTVNPKVAGMCELLAKIKFSRPIDFWVYKAPSLVNLNYRISSCRPKIFTYK